MLNGWGASFGANGRPALFRKGVKVFGRERVHPSMTVTGRQGPDLKCPIVHHVDKNLSDMLARLDRDTTARALDLIDKHEIGSTANNFRKIFSRFWKCYAARKGYREGAYGLAIAICGALYPLISHLKAKLEGRRRRWRHRFAAAAAAAGFFLIPLRTTQGRRPRLAATLSTRTPAAVIQIACAPLR